MKIYLINPNLTASNSDPKPVKGNLKGAELRDKIKAWENRNKYEVDDKSKVKSGDQVTGTLLNGVLHVKLIIK